MRNLFLAAALFLLGACGTIGLAPGSRYTETTSWCVPASMPMPKIPRVGDIVAGVGNPRGGAHQAQGSVQYYQHVDARGQIYRHHVACRHDQTQYVW